MVKSAPTGGGYRIAVLPIDNLSGGKAPLKELGLKLAGNVKAAGFDILPDASLDRFMARHRMRNIGGIDEDLAKAFAEEEGVKGVLVSSLEYYADSFPPKISVTSRLVSTGNDPEILWMDSAALAGNDAPGIFDTGLIREAATLSDKAFGQLARSLSADFAVGFRGEQRGAQKIFPPRRFYRKALAADKQFRIVVLPLYNRSGRKYAGEIMALHFVQELHRLGNFHVVEPGMVRSKLLQHRLIMEGGVSNANADVIFDVLRANMLLTGKVLDYQDARGESGIPTVDFSTAILDRESHMLVLSADSYNTGDERVHFFDLGRINTACGLAMEMVRGIVGQLVPR